MKMRYEEVEPVTDNVFLIKARNEGRFPYSHSILIFDEEIGLIDTGCGIEILKHLKREHKIDFVINSHTHPDHSAGNWVFRDRPIYVPEEGFHTSGDMKALSERLVSKDLAPTWRRFAREYMGFKNCKPTHVYDEKTIFDFGKTMLEPIYTPGHTKDHYCFYEQKERILFSFDYDLTSFPWYGHRESSILQFEKSVNKLRTLSPKIVVSSHKGVITENIPTEFEKFRKILDERDEKILSLLQNEKTIDQVAECAPIYGKFPYAESLLEYWERQMIKKHLERLVIAGKVKKHRKQLITKVYMSARPFRTGRKPSSADPHHAPPSRRIGYPCRNNHHRNCHRQDSARNAPACGCFGRSRETEIIERLDASTHYLRDVMFTQHRVLYNVCRSQFCALAEALSVPQKHVVHCLL
jgi:glyoxylase-like metal-dependent hydrolase (beta-lactamase superfamily II)